MHLAPKAPSRSTGSRIVTPPFALAVVLLGTAAILAGPVANWLNLKEGKKALPLRAPLSALNEGAIAPYRVKDRRLLDPTIVEALGTDRYVEWLLEDTSLQAGDPLREMNLFVTYYSGGHNLVPHTPDVCYLGGGYVKAQPHENRKFEVPALGSASSRVPVRVCTFVQTGVFDHRRFSVVYTFHCNGHFVATRTGVRVLINDPSNTHSYFSKVEANFPGASRAQAIEGARKLFQVVLPVLVRDHWPDFEAEERAADQPTTVSDNSPDRMSSGGGGAAFSWGVELKPKGRSRDG